MGGWLGVVGNWEGVVHVLFRATVSTRPRGNDYGHTTGLLSPLLALLPGSDAALLAVSVNMCSHERRPPPFSGAA
jgi:hypothetical protein